MGGETSVGEGGGGLGRSDAGGKPGFTAALIRDQHSNAVVQLRSHQSTQNRLVCCRSDAYLQLSLNINTTTVTATATADATSSASSAKPEFRLRLPLSSSVASQCHLPQRQFAEDNKWKRKLRRGQLVTVDR